MKLFRRRRARVVSPGDMRTTPVDNPLDWRDDGSIRPGDPAFDTTARMLKTGESFIANQRPDGTWNVQFHAPEDSSK